MKRAGKDGNPNTILGILKCANDAARDLHSRLPQRGIKWLFASFTLITNKEVTEDAQTAFDKIQMMF